MGLGRPLAPPEAPNLAGRTVVLTGGTDGLGRPLAALLSLAGARLFLLARDLDKAEAVRQALPASAGVHVIQADLASLSQVRAAVQAINEETSGVDLLINNAGVLKRRFELSADGFETMLAVNHLAVAALTLGLEPLVRVAGGHVVVVNSVGHRSAVKRPQDKALLFEGWREPGNFSPMLTYARSKLLSLLWARRFAQLHPGTAVTAIHPGLVRTSIGRELPAVIRWLVNTFVAIPAEEAAANVLAAANRVDQDKLPFLYLEARSPVEPSAAAQRDDLAQLTWQWTAASTAHDH